MFVSVLFLLSLVSRGWGGDPPGHLLPLGSHMSPQTVEEIGEFPHPERFYEDYVKYGKPVLFKSTLEKTGSKPMQQWNDEYMRREFGEAVVDVESGKKENRDGDLEEMTLTQFLDTYRSKDVYLVQDLTHRMKKDVTLPYSVRCGGVQRRLTKGILWFSSGGTKSVLHADEFDNINCLLDGAKDFVIFDRQYSTDIETDGYVLHGSYSSLDVDRVDMYKFPLIQHLPHYKAHMEKGDCLFIPTGWYHQVNSFGPRNLAINVWFYHPLWFNVSDCSGDAWKTSTTMDHFPYAGVEEGLREVMLEPLEMEESVTEEEFLDRWYYISIDEHANSQVFRHLDADGDGRLTWGELYRFDVEDVYKRFPTAFGNDFREYYRERKHVYSLLLPPRDEEGEEENEGDIPRDEL